MLELPDPVDPVIERILHRIYSDPYRVERILQARGIPRFRLFSPATVAVLRPVAYLMELARVAPEVLAADWPFDHSAWGPDQRLRALRNTLGYIHGSAYLDGWLNP